MSNLCLVDCANCGQQTMIDLDRPEDTCLFCGKNAREKEVIMVEKEAAEEAAEAVQSYNKGPVPPRPKKRKKWPEYYEENKEAIIADYHSMTVRAFFKRWSLGTTTWPKLKEKWEVPSKGRGGSKTAKRTEYKEPKPKAGEFCLLITEEDLAKLDDDDFRLIWVVLGRIIKSRLKKRE